MITLNTRDGSKIGNAIIFGGGLNEGMDPVFFVETDFGNKLTLTWAEIEGMFTIGRAMPYSIWADHRRQAENRPFITPDYIMTPDQEP